jgi:AraC family transcriptional regulator of adaptative response/methylated-DNA-[protein]-cysteine methyltransferase
LSQSHADPDENYAPAFQGLFARPKAAERERNVIHLDWLQTPLGPLLLGATDRAVCLLEFSSPRRIERQVASLGRAFDAQLVPGTNEALATLRGQLGEYFAGTRREFDVPLDHRGTPFQRRVWQALLEIPYGETRSYLDIARRVGDAQASRAVGTANGSNRIAIVIPCHRVVNSNGALGGYGGGLSCKRFLLDIERGQFSLA